jgi:hypothetical protein
VKVIGEIRNDGPTPAGVEVEAILRGVDGRLLDTSTFWPASTNNIPLGRSTGVWTSFLGRSLNEVESVELQVVGSRAWR